MAYDLRPFTTWITEEFAPSVHVGQGAGDYTRRGGGEYVEVYGTGDMACILYTLDSLNPTPTENAEWASTLRSFQDPGSGYLIAKTASLSKVHNTAFSLGAMNLFDAQPDHPLVFSRNFITPELLQEYIESRDWTNGVYLGGEDVIGLASAFALVPGTVSDDWFIALFDYFDDNLFDPNNGMIGRDTPSEGTLDQIGGTFHFDFFWQYFDRAMPFAEQRIDAILGLQRDDGDWDPGNPWWMPFDAIYMLARAVSSCGHRVEDVRDCARGVVALAYDRIMDGSSRESYFVKQDMGVHTLNGALGLFAVGQNILGSDELQTTNPLRLVLDRRPYI